MGAFREEPLYELTTVMGEGKLVEALRKLNQLWEQGYNPLQILAGITNTLRRLLVARELLGGNLRGLCPKLAGFWSLFRQEFCPN